jgi:hypothetical protein
MLVMLWIMSMPGEEDGSSVHSENDLIILWNVNRTSVATLYPSSIALADRALIVEKNTLLNSVGVLAFLER